MKVYRCGESHTPANLCWERSPRRLTEQEAR